MEQRAVIPDEVLRRVSKGPVRGYVPAVENGQAKLIHWSEGAKVPRNGKDGPEDWNPAVLGSEAIPDREVERIRASLPPMPRRTPRERYRVLCRNLLLQGMESVKAFGYPVWPKSIQDELREMGWKEGNPDLYAQVEVLARRTIEQGARMQAAQDQKQVALGWHGHLSA